MSEKLKRRWHSKPLIDMSIKPTEEQTPLDGKDLLKKVFGTAYPENIKNWGSRQIDARSIRAKNPKTKH